MNRFVLIALLSLWPLYAETRTWTRAADQKKVEAEFVSADDSQVTLKTKRGKTMTVDLSVFSEEDQEWVAAKIAPPPPTPAESKSYFTDGVGPRRWTVRYPANVPEADRVNCPLCILYNASGNPIPLANAMAPGCDELGWITIVVHCYSNGNAQKDREGLMAQCQAIFAEIEEKISFDKDKVMFGGFSGGGWWSYASTVEVYDNAVGVISFGGWMGNKHDRDYPKKMTVAMINGDGDKGAIQYEKIDGDVLRKDYKAKVKAFHFKGGHVEPKSEVTSEAMRWVHETAGF